MSRLPFAIAAAALFAAAPALAQPPRGMPSGADIEAMAPALDRMMEGMLDVDVGPMVDAVDPFARHPGYGRPGRTLGAIGRRNDPNFDRRLRDSLYGTTAGMARMADAFAAATPALRRSLDQFRAGIGAAIDDYHRNLPPGDADDGWDREDDEPDEDDPY